jgi:hypothetical protein
MHSRPPRLATLQFGRSVTGVTTLFAITWELRNVTADGLPNFVSNGSNFMHAQGNSAFAPSSASRYVAGAIGKAEPALQRRSVFCVLYDASQHVCGQARVSWHARVIERLLSIYQTKRGGDVEHASWRESRLSLCEVR